MQPGNGVGLFWDTHIHIYLLTYLLACSGPTRGEGMGGLVECGSTDG